MYSLSEIRRQVDALRRRLAPELAVLRLRKLATEFCCQWDTAIANHQPAPAPHPFILRVAGAGFRLNTFTTFHKYLDRCREDNRHPQPSDIVSKLLPWAARDGYLAAFKWDAPAAST